MAACSRLRVARAEVMTIKDLDCLVVERFDRTLTDDMRIQRLHQEDFCQALGILPSVKYEIEGGPSVSSILDTIRHFGTQPARSVADFIDAVIFNFLIGNSDSHGKNYALLYDPIGSPVLAPLYDLVCTAVYDVEQALAMSIGGETDPTRVDGAAWRRFAVEAGLSENLLIRRLHELAKTVATCANAVRTSAQAEGWFCRCSMMSSRSVRHVRRSY